MKKITATICALVLTAALTACNESGTPIEDNSQNQGSAQNESSSQEPESTSSEDESSSEESSSTESTSSIEHYVPLTERDADLKGEELIAKLKWPYDAPIELDGARAQKLVDTTERGDVYEDIELSELSNEFYWDIFCDYGYLATAPENGGEYEFKKYKVGDTIGDFTVDRIITRFTNANWTDCDYFRGTAAGFDGEVTLTGEVSVAHEHMVLGEIIFYPDEESCKKLPIVNYKPMLGLDYIEDTFDDIRIDLSDRSDYPEIDFSKFPLDTRVKAKVKIKNYGYRVMSELSVLGFGSIADGELELL